MEDINKILEQLHTINTTFGVVGVIIALIFLISTFFLSKYLIKRVEKKAEITSDKILQKFKNNLDKELEEFSIRFSLKHQRQAKAIEELYNKFATLTSCLTFLIKGDKYEEQEDPYEDYNRLIKYRRELIETFELRKIYLPISLVIKVNNIYPVLENFIDTYKSGLMPSGANLIVSSDDNDSDKNLVLAGIWNQKDFDKVVVGLSAVKDELEDLFRHVVET